MDSMAKYLASDVLTWPGETRPRLKTASKKSFPWLHHATFKFEHIGCNWTTRGIGLARLTLPKRRESIQCRYVEGTAEGLGCLATLLPQPLIGHDNNDDDCDYDDWAIVCWSYRKRFNLWIMYIMSISFKLSVIVYSFMITLFIFSYLL